jgi:hypothetical protein
LLCVPSVRAELALREVEKWLGFFILGQQRDRTQRRGAPANTALTELIRRFRRIFRRSYRGPRTRRPEGVVFQPRSEQHKRELEFVSTALLDARIISRRYLPSLPRLFLDLRSVPAMSPKERGDAIERMAKKVRRARDGEQPALVLAEKIKQGKLAADFSARDIQRKGWRHLGTTDQVQSALDRLIREGWLQAVRRGAGVKGGRPTLEYKIDPKQQQKNPASETGRRIKRQPRLA